MCNWVRLRKQPMRSASNALKQPQHLLLPQRLWLHLLLQFRLLLHLLQTYRHCRLSLLVSQHRRPLCPASLAQPPVAWHCLPLALLLVR